MHHRCIILIFCSMWQHKVYRICVLIFLTFQHRFHEFFRTLLKHIICKIEHKIQSFTQKPRKITHIFILKHTLKSLNFKFKRILKINNSIIMAYFRAVSKSLIIINHHFLLKFKNFVISKF